MRLLTAFGCRNRRDLAACLACYAIVFVPLARVCWPA